MKTKEKAKAKRKERIETIKADIVLHKKMHGAKQDYWRIYLTDLLTVLGIADKKQIEVVIYITENVSKENNTFIGTYKKIAKEVNVTEPTIAKIMKKLQEQGFIKKVQNGAWQVNHRIVPGENDERIIIIQYEKSDTGEMDALNLPFEELSLFEDT